jgi:hypothetical protein
VSLLCVGRVIPLSMWAKDQHHVHEIHRDNILWFQTSLVCNWGAQRTFDQGTNMLNTNQDSKYL